MKSVVSSESMLTMSKDENLVLSSEDSSYPDESELELGLGLSLGGASKVQQAPVGGQYVRFLTAKDFPSMISPSSSWSSSSSSVSSSSSSSRSMSRSNATAGTKRNADSVSATNGCSQVVGWPPIRAHRMNSLVNQVKSLEAEVKNTVTGKSNSDCDKKNENSIEKGNKRSLFVKVNMDGVPIGRKVNLSSHSCYETLAQALEDMFHGPTTVVNAIRSGKTKHDTTRCSKLLDGSSEFVLTYEDKEGDWMLVGDVPWGMFLSSAVKRLRIMRTPDANGLGCSKAARKE